MDAIYTAESDHKVTEEMVSLVPQLHTFARSLCRDGVRADDLVQEALLRAFDNIERFKPGTNLKAWLFTIVRNEHYSQLRRRKFEAHDIPSDLLPEPSVPPDHDGELELRDLNRALTALSPGQRAALILVSASGFSYEEAATICGCAVGTIKSRVARARTALLQMLEGRMPAPAPASDAALPAAAAVAAAPLRGFVAALQPAIHGAGF
ncbi:MAG TPA: sigma-70 family RNA polymerase sigma factor [Steroidobacteraceae bacterium]|nr:sigma-70 family RNA polymerase sigma factor [Steroidobacteraceae bacterium]